MIAIRSVLHVAILLFCGNIQGGEGGVEIDPAELVKRVRANIMNLFTGAGEEKESKTLTSDYKQLKETSPDFRAQINSMSNKTRSVNLLTAEIERFKSRRTNFIEKAKSNPQDAFKNLYAPFSDCKKLDPNKEEYTCKKVGTKAGWVGDVGKMKKHMGQEIWAYQKRNHQIELELESELVDFEGGYKVSYPVNGVAIDNIASGVDSIITSKQFTSLSDERRKLLETAIGSLTIQEKKIDLFFASYKDLSKKIGNNEEILQKINEKTRERLKDSLMGRWMKSKIDTMKTGFISNLKVLCVPSEQRDKGVCGNKADKNVTANDQTESLKGAAEGKATPPSEGSDPE